MNIDRRALYLQLKTHLSCEVAEQDWKDRMMAGRKRYRVHAYPSDSTPVQIKLNLVSQDSIFLIRQSQRRCGVALASVLSLRNGSRIRMFPAIVIPVSPSAEPTSQVQTE